MKLLMNTIGLALVISGKEDVVFIDVQFILYMVVVVRFTVVLGRAHMSS